MSSAPSVVATFDKADSQALADCLSQLPEDLVGPESAHDHRQLAQWGFSRLKP